MRGWTDETIDVVGKKVSLPNLTLDYKALASAKRIAESRIASTLVD